MTAYTPKRDEALFRLDGDLLVPGALSKGPWYEGTLHGSAMLAAIARGAEQHPSDVPRQVVRLTVDMMRAAPMAPLRVTTTTVRQGRAMDVVEVSMYADDDLCVRGTALRARLTDLDVDDPDEHSPSPPVPGSDVALPPLFGHPGAERPAFHHGIDVHIDLDAATVWFRLMVPIVEGEVNSPFLAVATLADWTYAAPRLMSTAAGTAVPPAEQTVFAINADTTVNTHRPLDGEWLGIRTVSHVGSLGAGSSGAHLFDQLGALGFSSQSVLLRGPGRAPLSLKELSPDA
ncbi:MAG: hypothetical protein RL238_1663 [Actinomycetota bacterium]|jgi:acyl-coenzyme A thioesterase PaaI-like protein